ncbi:MAG: hypothetical protein CL592_00355 [Alteromonas sp.]|nr:hypothetical protein [Alteromonas sp.]|tara:strand:- start:8229 stop:8594 length:366 start_codon:yes stop_codon:yes gene_type:complete
MMLASVAVAIILMLTPVFWWAVLIGGISLCLAMVWPLNSEPYPQTWIVDEAGEGYTVISGRQDNAGNWQISPRSKLLPGALYLVRYFQQSQRFETCWLFPWQVQDKDYRRLARIVFRQGQL